MPDYRLGRLRGEFCVVWNEPDGRRRRYRLGTREPKEARSILREFIKHRDAATSPRGSGTIAEIWNDYITEKEAEGVSSTPRMRDAWKRLRPDFSGLHPGDVTPSCVRCYTASRRKQGASDGPIHTEL